MLQDKTYPPTLRKCTTLTVTFFFSLLANLGCISYDQRAALTWQNIPSSCYGQVLVQLLLISAALAMSRDHKWTTDTLAQPALLFTETCKAELCSLMLLCTYYQKKNPKKPKLQNVPTTGIKAGSLSRVIFLTAWSCISFYRLSSAWQKGFLLYYMQAVP